MNPDPIIALGFLIFLVVIVVGGIIHAWAQRDKSNKPETFNWILSMIGLVGGIAFIFFGAIGIATMVGGFTQEVLPSNFNAPQMPQISDLVNTDDGAGGGE